MTQAGCVRKTVYLKPDEWEAIRLAAYERNVAYSHVIQEAVRAVLMGKASWEDLSR